MAQEPVGPGCGSGGRQTGAEVRTLGGVVTDMDGALVPGAQVVLRTADGMQQSMVTDAGGHFRFAGVGVGAFTVMVSARGWRGRLEGGR